MTNNMVYSEPCCSLSVGGPPPTVPHSMGIPPLGSSQNLPSPFFSAPLSFPPSHLYSLVSLTNLQKHCARDPSDTTLSLDPIVSNSNQRMGHPCNKDKIKYLHKEIHPT